MNNTLDEFINEQMQDPKFKAEYDALEPEFTLRQAMIDARKREGLTQKKLAAVSGISQADISRLERGTGNPSIKTLQRVAKALNMVLKIEFIPLSTVNNKQ